MQTLSGNHFVPAWLFSNVGPDFSGRIFQGGFFSIINHGLYYTLIICLIQTVIVYIYMKALSPQPSALSYQYSANS
jgi:hypothetical protein